MLTVKQYERYRSYYETLHSYGITTEDAYALLKIERALRRWAEAECNGYIERGESGAPYAVTNGRRYAIPDREERALKQLEKIMGKYPHLLAHHQTDPRGSVLTILRKADVADGEDIGSVYTRGVCIGL